jgi:hypothetical protein
MYKSFAAKYGKEAAKVKTPEGRMQVFLDVMNQTAQSFAKQNLSRSVVGGTSDAKEESRDVLESFKSKLNEPNPSRTNMPVPTIEPLAYMPDMPTTNVPTPSPSGSLRDRVRQNPALAATLLGGLGNAGLL